MSLAPAHFPSALSSGSTVPPVAGIEGIGVSRKQPRSRACPPRRIELRPLLLACLIVHAPSAEATVILKDDFSAYGTSSTNLNLHLPATNGAALPTSLIRQSGSVGAWRYTEQGADANTQIGNPSTQAGQAGAPGYADYLLLAYTGQVASNLPIGESLAQGLPLSISFDLGTALPPGYDDSAWWAAFRLGALGEAYPVIGSAPGFAFLYRINKGVQVFTTNAAPVELSGATGNHFTLVFSDPAGSGSAFAGKGSKVALYNGTTLLGAFDTAQLTQSYMNFSVQNAFASLDNLVVETGVPAFLTDRFRITDSRFDFTAGKLGLTWNSEPGKTYRITRSAALSGPWTAVGEEIDAAAVITSTAVDFTQGDKGFYRVETAVPGPLVFDGTQVRHDVANKRIVLSDATGKLQLRLGYDRRCLLDRVQVNGRETIAPLTGACTGILVGGNWVTTRALTKSPLVTVNGGDVTLQNIEFASGGVSVRETWLFHTGPAGIDWTITRQYLTGGTLDDSYFPGWDFAGATTWTAGLLDTGGVAWSRFLGPGTSFGTHCGSVDFWKGADGLKIATSPVNGAQLASRFSHQPGGALTFAQSVNPQPLATRHLLHRFISGMDVWAPFQAVPGTLQTRLHLQATDAKAGRNRGDLKGLDGESVQDVLDTIARYGVIDRRLVGGNGWLSGYICLHEPFFGQMALAIADPAFTANLASSLDAWRDHALQPSGRVYSRWHHDSGDNVAPGTYDPVTGYYDCGWGVLLDSQTDYPINVAEQFDLTGDKPWLQGQKEPCERALNWLLARDSDGDGLVEALTDSHTQQKSSDWIDIVWASGENALVNAKLYYALELWAEREEILGDTAQAATYRTAAAKLKSAFIKPVSQGGFWDPAKGWFIYWRNKDGSLHGNNLVTPVNFCAVAYGLCTDDQRQRVLSGIETRMRQENLFHWPLCFLPFAADEGGGGPFPTYENGDIFLSWGEVAVRAYAGYDPAIAVAYVKRLLTQYQTDGLSAQRYFRATQQATGDDILAGNCMTVVGLYRDIYGVRPQWNRLMVDPHLTPALEGTRLVYPLRGQSYSLLLGAARSSVTVDGFTATSSAPFAVNPAADRVSWYSGVTDQPSLTIVREPSTAIALTIQSWPATGIRQWTESIGTGAALTHAIHGLTPSASYTLTIDGVTASTLIADLTGTVTFQSAAPDPTDRNFTLAPSDGNDAGR